MKVSVRKQKMIEKQEFFNNSIFILTKVIAKDTKSITIQPGDIGPILIEKSFVKNFAELSPMFSEQMVIIDNTAEKSILNLGVIFRGTQNTCPHGVVKMFIDSTGELDFQLV